MYINKNINQWYVAILLDELLSSFGKLKNSTLEKALGFRSEEQVELVFNSSIGFKSFTIQLVFEGSETNGKTVGAKSGL